MNAALEETTVANDLEPPQEEEVAGEALLMMLPGASVPADIVECECQVASGPVLVG